MSYREESNQKKVLEGGHVSSVWCPNCSQMVSSGKIHTCPGMVTAQISSNEHTFSSGAKRSEVKPFYSAIPADSLRRLALRATGAPKGRPGLAALIDGHWFHYEGGSRGYGYGNWALGLEMEDTFNHIIEHLYYWKTEIEAGRIPMDDDLAAAAWGIMMPLMSFESRYVKGELRKSHDPETPRSETSREEAR